MNRLPNLRVLPRTESANGQDASAGGKDLLRRGGDMERLLSAATALASELLAAENEPAIPADRDPDRLRARLSLALGATGLEPEVVLDQVAELLRATPSSSSWRFVNQLFGGREPVAVVADMLATLANASMYTFKAAGAQVLVESELIRHMAATVGIPDAEGCFTPGGSLANLHSLLLARNAAFPRAREHGIGGQRTAVYTSAEGHYSIPKGAGILGLGRAAVRSIPVDSAGRMRIDSLRDQLAADLAQGVRPLLINVTAGTTVRGAFDPIRLAASVAREAGAWLHVDGALGASVVLSAEHRALVDGLDLADSISWNPHKMMGVPLQCSLLLVARKGSLAASLDEAADYLFQTHEAEHNPGRRSIQCGRRNDTLKLWAAWRRLGDRGWTDRIGRQFTLARLAATKIAADPVFELAEVPPSVNVCFRVRGVDSAQLCDELHRSGRLTIGHGQVGSQRALRLVCVNPDLDEANLDALLAEIKQAAERLQARG